MIESTDTLVATTAVTGTTLTVRAGVKGEATLTVTATDPGGLVARQSFAVTVLNRAPSVTTPIPAQTIFRGQPLTVDLAVHFGDLDGDTLSYSAVSSNGRVVQVQVIGSKVILSARSKGTAEVTVTAADPDGLTVQQTFTVMVGNRAPIVVTPIPAQTILRGRLHGVDLATHFGDPDGDTLSYSAVSADRRIVQVRVSGSKILLSARAKGAAEVTVTAADPDSLAVQQTFTMMVGNRAPVPVGSFPDHELGRDDRLTLPIHGYFRDPDGDTLTYEASTSEANIAQATAGGASVTLTGVSHGQTTLTLTATDPDGLTATQTSRITVVGQGGGGGGGGGGRAPITVGRLPAQTIAEGVSRTLVVSGYFRDPNGDPLTFSATTGNPDLATAYASGARVTLTGVARGQTTLTVTATDPGNLSTALSAEVTVVTQGQKPIVVAPIPEQRPMVGQAITVSVANHFQDPDGGNLDFDAVSSNPGVVTAAASGSNVTLTAVSVGRDPDGGNLDFDAVSSNPGVVTAAASGSNVTLTAVSVGRATVTVTATDPDELTVEQQFGVRVAQLLSPDLQVASPTVSDRNPTAGTPFTLSATVRNGGDGAAAATTLRYYRSPDATITTSDEAEGTDTVRRLAASATSRASIAVAAPAGTYYYGACVDVVAGESDTTNNCSAAVPVTVSSSPTNGGQPKTEVHLFRPESVEEHVGEVPLFVLAWTTENRAPTESIPVRVWLVAGTADEGVDFGSFTQSVEFNAADFTLRNSTYEAAKELTITIVNDSEAEGDETFGATMTLEHARPFVTLMSPDYPDQLIITILANDHPR